MNGWDILVPVLIILFFYVALGGPIIGYLRKGQWRKDK